MFTVGDMKWNWTKPRDYLAQRDEVRDHLGAALAPVSQKVQLETAFGHRASLCEEVDTPDGPRARVEYHPVDDTDAKTIVLARRAIHAAGLNYRVADPLPLGSANVVSVIPQDLLATLDAHPGAPVYVVGGGKTGMDSILATLSRDPGRSVTLLKGGGTNFLNRTRYLPTGLSRWTSGDLVSRVFRDLAIHFDGENEASLIDHFRRTHATDPDTANAVFLYGLQSEEEHARIADGLETQYADYLDRVEDGPDGPVMTLRSGATSAVPPGSIFVNCTGSFFRTPEMTQALPGLSARDTILSLNARDGFHFLTSVAGFFTTHLLYRGELRGRGFYFLDHEALFRKNRNAWIGASSAQAYLNQVIAVQTLPLSLLDACGLDLDRWYPLPRRMAGLVRMKATASRDIAHCRKVLDRVADRFGVTCTALT